MIKAVIFDLDDTLIPTEPVYFDIENTVLVRMGYSPASHEIYLENWEKPRPEGLLTHFPGIDVEVYLAIYKDVLVEYREAGKLDVIPEVHFEVLDRLIGQGKTIMILTSRNYSDMKRLLQPDHAVAGRVTAFYYRDTVKIRKPDPRVFNELLHDAHLLPEECVYVGDSRHDARAAKGAGMYFIASLESGLRKQEDFSDLWVDIFVEKFSDVVLAVQNLDGLQTI